MRIDSNSGYAPRSLVPWFVDLADEASLDVKSDRIHYKQKKSAVELAEQVNKKLEQLGTHIQVKIHDKTNTIMVLVMRDETNEVIREIPSEKMLDIMYNLSSKVGVFLDEKM
ncbi:MULTISPECIES: flagellar protein FlaG [Paenibacillus]|uniref:Flagellar protein FlaG n=1 Tax=Paenibacillus albilobatus TaxID=2716884 RepID=A0A920CDZ9_9BACL|nr:MULTISPECIES: flagellar protein FlaG [Paenibacillus]GIO33297.1 hypothetical protein J2TS6_44380 [Paenibacillus albilobatus]